MGFYDWDKMTPENISELYTRKVARGDNIVVARVEVMQWAVTQPHTHESEEVIIVLKRWRTQSRWTSARQRGSIG